MMAQLVPKADLGAQQAVKTVQRSEGQAVIIGKFMLWDNTDKKFFLQYGNAGKLVTISMIRKDADVTYACRHILADCWHFREF